jgi:TonB family protein
VGQLLDGRYKLVREIASGGMSVVYEAIHVKIGRIVAIKVLHRDMAGDPEVVGRFLNEARAVGTFGHPNIVASTDFGELPGHVPYLVLEYLNGHTLADTVQREGPLSIRRTVRIALQIASALDAAHARDVIHRDLTASNIFLVTKETNPDHVKVLDFGISKFLAVGDSGPKTRRGLTMGTPEYLAPEQISDPDAVDARVDVYALGVIMYFMLRGELPFTRMPLQSLLTQIVVEAPPLIERSGIPDGLRVIVLRALAKNPTDRFPTMRDMGVELERLSARIFTGTDWLGARDGSSPESGGASSRVPLTPSAPVNLSVRPGSASVSYGAPSGPSSAPTSAPVPPTTDPVVVTRGGRGLLYVALGVALLSLGGVALLLLRPQRGPEPRPEAPAPALVAPAPVIPPAPPTLAPLPTEVRVTSATALARVTLRGRTHLLPYAQEVKAGSEPEVVELTAPGREGRRFWLTLDHPIVLKAELPEGKGVVEATEEETAVALGGQPIGGEGQGHDKTGGSPHHVGAHRHSGGKSVGAQSAPTGDTVPSESPTETRSVPPASPEPKAAPLPVAAKVEVPAPTKPDVSAAPTEPAPVTPKVRVTPPAPTPGAGPPVAKGLDPVKTQAIVRSHLPEVQRCYERGKMDDPEIRGRITLRIVVGVTGKVTSAMVENSSVRSSAVESCVLDAVQGWTFPAPVGGPAVISYPFNLR